MLDTFRRDLRFATRMLGKDRAFTLIAVTVLGMGIGIANLQFVLVNAFCLRGLPIPGVQRVLFLSARDAQQRDVPLSYRDLEAIQSGTRSFAGVAGFANATVVIGDEARAADRAAGTFVSAGLFNVLAEKPTLGRDFQPADDRPGAPPVVILGDRLWKSRYNADRSIIGRQVRINGTPAIVIGVMAKGFRFPSNTDVWQPLATMPGVLTEKRAARSLSVVGRLATGATIAGVRGELDAVGRELSRLFPEQGSGTRLTAIPINQRYNARITDPTWLAFIGVGVIVLLIASANTANLLLMRSVRRGHEMAVRASLGASRGRLVQQLLAESTVLATLGAIAGTLLSLAGVRILTGSIPENTLGYFTKFTIDGVGFAVLCVMCLGTVFIFGLAPALHVSRTDVSHVMKDGGRGGSTGVKARRWTMAFLTAEFGLTLVLLAALASSVRVARVAQRAATEVDPTGVMTASIAAGGDRYRSDEQRLTLYRQLEERLGAEPGVSSVAVASALPLNGGAARHLVVDGRTLLADTSATVMTVAIGAQYFDVVSAPLLRGRSFVDRDGSPGYESAIVNERLAEMYFPQGDAIGRRVRLADSSSLQPAWLTIVGVSPKVRQRAVTDPDPVLYLPLRSAPPASAVVAVRGRGEATELVTLLRETVRGIDPELPIYRVRPMEQALQDAEWMGRVSTVLLNTIALVAMLLAAVGLYAVSAHAVVQRKMEIGIRMALGARGAHVIWMVVRRAVVQLALGLVAGVSLTLAFEKLVGLGVDTSGVRMSDPLTLVAAALLLAIVTAIACVAPVVRASRLDPALALRTE